MTNFHYENIVCPHCLNEERIAIWDIIDAKEDSDLKEKILLKELQVFECQNCNHKYDLDKPYLFIDPNNNLMIYYTPQNREIFSNKNSRNNKTGTLNDKLRSELPKDFGVNIDNYILRIVTSYNDLIEKIHIFDHGLDDRLIEIIKIATKLNPPQSDLSSDDEENNSINELYFLGIENTQLLFQSLSADNMWKQLLIKNEVYNSALNLVGNNLPLDENWNVVDELSSQIFLDQINLFKS